ncbi:MAG: VWA domain-containing protein [Planctomycetes bacterium]|nr:VWA domain-containing protein [Planctomycetota bacterium]
MEQHRVSVDIIDGVARTTVRQVFRNPNGMQLEGMYMFPLPDGAAVSNFSMMMGGKMVAGEVLEKDKAASIYEGIVRRQQDPALLEYMGNRLFRARVFPIPARGVSEIELSYDQTLTRDGRTVEWRYPYRTRSVSGAPVGQASVHVKLKSTDPVLTVYSPSHEVDVVKKGDHDASVSYESKQDPGDRDFVVVYGLAKDGSVGATLFAHGEGENSGAFLLLLAPSSELDKGRTLAKDVVFVVDTSGSMSGAKMEQTKKALRYCINSMGEKDRFNLVPFATEASMWKGELVPATSEHKDSALGFVAKMEARGGTNINDALVQALSMSQDKDRPLMVIFMTDGEPTIGITATKGILENVKVANKALTRLFVFGVGENLKVDLLDLLAEQNHGARDYVGSKENIEVKVSSFFEKVSSPVLSDVKLDFSGVEISDLYPKRLPDLFRGSQLLITGRFRGAGTGVVKLTGKVEGTVVEHVFERTFKDGKDKTSFVPRLWAVRKVGYLMDQIRLNGANEEIHKEVVRLGKKYGIVTPYTSYLVLEDDVAAVAPGRGGGGGGVVRRGGRFLGRPVLGGGTGASRPYGGLPPGTLESEEAKANAVRRLREVLALGAKRKDGLQPGDKSAEARAQENRDRDPGKGRGDATSATLIGTTRSALEQSYFADAIALSKAVKLLREKRTADGGIAGGLVRRVGNRTFLVRVGVTLESVILDLDPDVLLKKLVRIEAFSPEYFELLKKKGLAQVLALGNSLLFIDGDRTVQIVPAGSLEKPKPGAEKKDK